MAKYALIQNGVYVKTMESKRQPVDIPHKGVVWLPVVYENIDNSVTPKTTITVNKIIEQDRYLIQSITRDLTQTEIDGQTEVHKNDALLKLDKELDVTTAMFKVLFNLNNRVRVLEGRAPETLLTFKQNFRNIL